MSAQAYIADYDNTDKVYLDVEPTPVPFLKYNIVNNRRRTLHTRNAEGNTIPGQWHHYSSGTHISGASIDVNVVKMTKITYNNLISKIAGQELGVVIFSPDDGTTKYKCSFSSTSSEPKPIQGANLLTWRFTLDVISQL